MKQALIFLMILGTTASISAAEDYCGAVKAAFSDLAEGTGDAAEKALGSLQDIYKNWLKEGHDFASARAEKDLCLFGFAYRVKGKAYIADRLVPDLVPLLDSNLSEGARINLIVDLGNLGRGKPDVVTALCKQLPNLRLRDLSFLEGALQNLGSSSNLCPQKRSADSLYEVDSPLSLLKTQPEKKNEVELYKAKDLNKVDVFHPTELSAILLPQDILEIRFACRESRVALFGWFCPNCNADELRSGANIIVGSTTKQNLHVYEPGSYRLKLTCSGRDIFDYNKGFSFEVTIPPKGDVAPR